MTKLVKKKTPKSKLKGTKKGKIEKATKKRLNGKVKHERDASILEDPDEDETHIIKRKPSKVELKSVIESLKKDPRLIVVRKALKYLPYYLKSEGLIKKLLKEIIRLWAEAGEKIRVVCLLCLVRTYTKIKDKERKQLVIKKLYSTFLDKCRITKPETMSMIGFMRHSLIELYKLDEKIALKQAQTSCQQLTLTLKNAYTHKNEETYKTVLNWQFANCLILLSSLIASHGDDSPIRSLTHQVIQLNLGAINFLTSPRYYPYYCHLIENLITLSSATNLFIPVLPLMIGIIDKIQFQKKKEKKKGKDEEEEKPDEKAKEYNMDTLNHVGIEEAHSLEYQAAVLNKIHELMVQYLSSQCHKIAFPELVLLPCVQLKKWTKKNTGHESVQKFVSLLLKIKSNCDQLEEARRSINFAFTDFTAVDAWEKMTRDSNKLSLLIKAK